MDFSPLAYLAKHDTIALLMHRMRLLSGKRFARLAGFDRDIILWNLQKGIPFADSVFDVVYHSHFLEHLGREDGGAFLNECYRVLKPSGILRVVVPDLEVRCRNYLQSLQRSSEQPPSDVDAIESHEWAIHEIIGQMVVGEPAGTTEQPPFRRAMERALRGNTARIGEAHLWMYDRCTLQAKLWRAGFRDIRVESARTGRIAGWASFLLDTNEDRSVYKPDSLYMEGVKPVNDATDALGHGYGAKERDSMR